MSSEKDGSSGTATADATPSVLTIFERVRPLLYERFKDAGSVGLLAALMKSDTNTPENPDDTKKANSELGINIGVQAHPFDYDEVLRLQNENEHHSTCIQTKVGATVGLGYLSDAERKNQQAARAGMGGPVQAGSAAQVGASLAKGGGGGGTGSVAAAPPTTQLSPDNPALSGDDYKPSKVDDALDPLCSFSWQDTLTAVGEDYWQLGHGLIEVVREGLPTTGSTGGPAGVAGKIRGLYHIPGPQAFMFLENANYDRHWWVIPRESTKGEVRMARFGDLADMRRRLGTGMGSGTASANVTGTTIASDMKVSEVIQIRRPTSLSRWYGYPDWISAVTAIELIQCARQHKYDFFNNRGVPEFLLFLMGQTLSKEDKKLLLDMVQANIGKGNSHKSIFMNFPGDAQTMKVQLEKLVADNKTEDTVDTTAEAGAVSIVTAHGVPPLLAGILVPGRLGSANELPNALMGFQALRIGPAQRIFKQTLGRTLGNKTLNGGLALTGDDFTPRKITEEIDIAMMQTTSQMRQTIPDAKAQGRDISKGLKD